MLGSAKTNLPLLTLTSWVNGISSFSTVLNKSDLKHQAWLLVTKTSKLAPTFNPDLLMLCFSKSAAAKQRMLNGFVPDVKMNRTYMQGIQTGYDLHPSPIKLLRKKGCWAKTAWGGKVLTQPFLQIASPKFPNKKWRNIKLSGIWAKCACFGDLGPKIGNSTLC